MVSRKPLSVSLTPELQAFVADMVKAGGDGSVSAVVRKGLRLLQERKLGFVPTADRVPSQVAKR